jgi:hypothetical protein
MIIREHALPITKQAEALNISRGSVYYLPRPASASDLELMRRLDRLHLELPFAGARMFARPAGCQGIQDRPSSREAGAGRPKFGESAPGRASGPAGPKETRIAARVVMASVGCPASRQPRPGALTDFHGFVLDMPLVDVRSPIRPNVGAAIAAPATDHPPVFSSKNVSLVHYPPYFFPQNPQRCPRGVRESVRWRPYKWGIRQDLTRTAEIPANHADLKCGSKN